MLGKIIDKAREFDGDFSDVTPGGISVRYTPEELQRKRQIHDEANRKLGECREQARHKRIEAKPGGNLKALSGPVTKPVPPDGEPPAELARRAEQQRAALLEMESRKEPAQ